MHVICLKYLIAFIPTTRRCYCSCRKIVVKPTLLDFHRCRRLSTLTRIVIKFYCQHCCAEH